MCQGVPIGILSISTVSASPMLEKDGKKKLVLTMALHHHSAAVQVLII